MRRRHLLAALGATVTAGCATLPGRRNAATARLPSSDPGGTTTTATATSPDESTTTGDEWLPDRSVVDLRTTDRTLALAPAGYTTADHGRVDLAFAAPATDDHPAVVRATLTNLNDFENTFRLDETPPFDPQPYARPRPTADRLGCYLAPTANHPLRQAEPEYVRADDGRWLLARERDWLPETVTLAPRETVRGEYHLVGHPDGRRPPLGRYEVAREFALGLTAWRTTRPGPTADSRLAGSDVPPLPGDRPVTWFHDAGPETPVHVEPAPERTRLPAALRFVLHNHSRTALDCESYAVYRRDGDRWRELESGYAHNACVTRRPGDRTAFWLRLFPGKVVDGVPGSRALADLSVDSGTFAFAASYDETYAALFELRPPDRAAST